MPLCEQLLPIFMNDLETASKDAVAQQQTVAQVLASKSVLS